eukprot:1751401-Amphidinium_carterae.1
MSASSPTSATTATCFQDVWWAPLASCKQSIVILADPYRPCAVSRVEHTVMHQRGRLLISSIALIGPIGGCH